MAERGKGMKITEDMLYGLLLELNERLRKDYMKESLNKEFIFEMMQIKRISVYNNEEKIQITVDKGGLKQKLP